MMDKTEQSQAETMLTVPLGDKLFQVVDTASLLD